MTTQAQDLPTSSDFDLLESAPIKPVNKKQIIIDHLRTYGLPMSAPDIDLFQKNGTTVKDSFSSYLSASDYYSTGSLVKLANGTPADFYYDAHDGLKSEIDRYKDRSHFDLGSFVHECILEPELWETVVCEPKANRASHEGLNTLIEFWENQTNAARSADISTFKVDAKKEYIATLIEASGKRVVEFKDALVIQKAHERWMKYDGGTWATILNAAIREVSAYTDDFMGLPMRVRPDGLLFADQIGVNAIVSVKTTSAPNIEAYKRQFMSLGYNMKEAAYQRIMSHITGLDFSTTIQIVICTSEPFCVGVFILSDSEMDAAFDRFAMAIDTAKICIQLGQYPGWEINAEEGSMGLIDLTIF